MYWTVKETHNMAHVKQFLVAEIHVSGSCSHGSAAPSTAAARRRVRSLTGTLLSKA